MGIGGLATSVLLLIYLVIGIVGIIIFAKRKNKLFTSLFALSVIFCLTSSTNQPLFIMLFLLLMPIQLLIAISKKEALGTLLFSIMIIVINHGVFFSHGLVLNFHALINLDPSLIDPFALIRFIFVMLGAYGLYFYFRKRSL